jgi:hypothetical protein
MNLNFAQLHIPGRGFRPSPPRSSGCGGGITEPLRGAEVTELVRPGEHNGQGESNARDKTRSRRRRTDGERGGEFRAIREVRVWTSTRWEMGDSQTNSLFETGIQRFL